MKVKNVLGFTMIELLVTMVIMGVITGMSWPLVRRLQEQNQRSKYSTYGDALVSAAKIYVDSYEEDLFFYEDDLNRMIDDPNQTKINSLVSGGFIVASDHTTQCAMISVRDMINHNLVKDINIEEMSCISDYSFVFVKKKGNNFQYKYYLGCGSSNSSNFVLNRNISLTIPEDMDVPETGGPSLTTYCK